MLQWRMLGSFSRSPLQAHTRDPNGHSQVSPARGTPPSSHKYSTLWIFWDLAGWKLCLRSLRFFYVQLKVSKSSHLIYVVL